MDSLLRWGFHVSKSELRRLPRGAQVLRFGHDKVLALSGVYLTAVARAALGEDRALLEVVVGFAGSRDALFIIPVPLASVPQSLQDALTGACVQTVDKDISPEELGNIGAQLWERYID